jgi:hypothetical protein
VGKKEPEEVGLPSQEKLPEAVMATSTTWWSARNGAGYGPQLHYSELQVPNLKTMGNDSKLCNSLLLLLSRNRKSCWNDTSFLVPSFTSW